MADDGTAVIILEGSKWRQCDVDMAFLTEKLKQPKEKIDTPGHKGIIIQPAMTIIACAIPLTYQRRLRWTNYGNNIKPIIPN